jgi:hypothetical protein
MKFFTPGLYLRYNSADEKVADRAEEEWESALGEYRSHVAHLSASMNSRVGDLAENLCLHDAEVLSFQEDIPEPPSSPLSPLPVAGIFLKLDSKNIHIFYFLWGGIVQARAPKGWPFSKSRTHWLYDEVDLERRQPALFWHRILLSDGRTIAIPFYDVVVQAFSDREPKSTIVSRRRA